MYKRTQTQCSCPALTPELRFQWWWEETPQFHLPVRMRDQRVFLFHFCVIFQDGPVRYLDIPMDYSCYGFNF